MAIDGHELLNTVPDEYRTDMYGFVLKMQNGLWENIVHDVNENMDSGEFNPWYNLFGSCALLHVGEGETALTTLAKCLETAFLEHNKHSFSKFFMFAFYGIRYVWLEEFMRISDEFKNITGETADKINAYNDKMNADKYYLNSLSYQERIAYSNRIKSTVAQIRKDASSRLTSLGYDAEKITVVFTQIPLQTEVIMDKYELFSDEDYERVKHVYKEEWLQFIETSNKFATIKDFDENAVHPWKRIKPYLLKCKDAFERILDGWEKYKADKLIREYWDNNQDLLNQLNSELDNNNNRLQEITDEINKQKECINEENNKNPFNIPEQKDLEELTKVKEDILKEISGLGVLQFSKKKKCETELLNVSNEINKLSNTISEKQIAYNKEMNAILTPYKTKISELQEQERDIKAEIKKIQQQLDNPPLD